MREPVRHVRAATGDTVCVLREFGRSLASLVSVGPRRFRRHAWASHGRGRIEIRGLLSDPEAGSMPSAVAEALRRVRGVRWAQVNAVTGHALVLFDERQVDLATLVEAVGDVEAAGGHAQDGWSRAEPPHPDDPAALVSAALGLAADVAGLGAALVSRVWVTPPVPTAARVAVGIIEAQPRIRRLLERGLGPSGTDAVVGLGSGMLNGLTGGVGPQLVTGLSHGLLVSEVRSRRAVWRARAAELEDTPGGLPEHPPTKSARPVAYPPGPVELFADRVAAASLLTATSVFALTRSPTRTANLLLVGVPPAARLGREAFAATLARRLARRGVVPMDPGVYRRLDRVTSVLIDERLHPDAELISELAGLPWLTVEVGDDHTGDTVRRLQSAGEAVLVVAGGEEDVLAAADVAVAVPLSGDRVGWAGDLIATSDPDTIAMVLRAVPAARTVSRRSVLVSAAGTVLAGAATIVSPVAVGDLTLQPVYLSGLLTQLYGARTARRL